jgi:hypothetical protein
MTASTAKLKNRGFLVTEADGGLLLVYPSRGKFEWEADELPFRSAVFTPDGRIVSLGWPKFFNQGEWPEHDAVIAAELEAGHAVITHKHDGTLIIRTALPDGRILFRTRNTFDGGEFGELAEAVAASKYPSLLDPTVWPHGSLLFEYVGTGNQIVVRYEGEDELIFLGAAEHAPARYLSFAELSQVADRHGFRLVETYSWAAEGITSILSLVQEWDTAEGVVVRSADGQAMLKIKSARYFAQHALRWHMTYEAICRFAIDGAIEDEEQLNSALTQAGWDYETTLTARDHFRRYLTARQEAARIREVVRAFVGGFEADTRGAFPEERARRKAFAARVFGPLAVGGQQIDSAAYYFLAYDGRWDILEATLLRRVILRAEA